MVNLITAISEFSFSGFYSTIKPMMLFVLGMLIYAVFIFKFYKFVARKDIFKLGLRERNVQEDGFAKVFFGAILYILEYLLFFPILTFFWFGILTILLTVLSKTQDIQQILLISMTLVAVIRITAYYNEELSKDLAKMLPFALLGIFIIDVTFFSFSQSLEVIKTIPSNYVLIFNYLLAVILLEFLLRVLFFISRIFTGKQDAEEEYLE